MPVYVRGGSILPIAPLAQRTAEGPKGPLTLRIHPLAPGLNTPGEACEAEVYTGDGHTFAFRKGEFARIHFACAMASDGSISVDIGKHKGTWEPWWHEYRVEVEDWTPKGDGAVDGRPKPLTREGGRWGIKIPANPEGSRIKPL